MITVMFTKMTTPDKCVYKTFSNYDQLFGTLRELSDVSATFIVHTKSRSLSVRRSLYPETKNHKKVVDLEIEIADKDRREWY